MRSLLVEASAYLKNFSKETYLRDFALWYAKECAWYVFPLMPGTKIPFPGTHGFKDATRDLAQVATWWESCPSANIGIDCERSGLLVFDIDPRNGGDVTWKHWLSQNPSAADLIERRAFVVDTPNGGQHYYTVGGGPATGRIGKGVDVKVTGYVVAPPSSLPNGLYLWR